MDDIPSLMEAIDREHIIPLDIGGPRRETRYVETKYPWNLGINMSSRHQHTRRHIEVKTLTTAGMSLILRTRFSWGGGRM
jgi:hypothetical protein